MKDKYRIDYSTGQVYEYDQEARAYLACGKTFSYTEEELEKMESEQV